MASQASDTATETAQPQSSPAKPQSTETPPTGIAKAPAQVQTKAEPSQSLATEIQAANAPPVDDLEENEQQELEVDTSDGGDSAYGGSDGTGSETDSIASRYKGHFEKYQSLRDTEYFMPTDETQWESTLAGHMLMLIMDSQRRNTLFRSPLPPNAQHVIDVGTGAGDWALDVADAYPNLIVHGVDLYPPPRPWTAPNCIFETDDVSQTWTWNHKFDFAHIRHLVGSFSNRDWDRVYRNIYNNLKPGGWIEQVEMDVGVFCDDDTMPKDSMLATQWRDLHIPMGERADRPLDAHDTMRGRIEAAGFINVHQQDYKCPLGTWPSLQVYKDAGRACKQQFKQGMEGWVMWLFTHYGEPNPWTPEQVQVFLVGIRAELDAGWHIYNKARRVWAQKPYDADPQAQSEPTVENVENVENTRAMESQSPETQGSTKKQKIKGAGAAEET